MLANEPPKPLVHASVLLSVVVVTMFGAALAQWHQRPLSRAAIQPQQVGYRIDINDADAATLALLPGVGPTIAQHIVELRQRQGPFESVDDLRQVSGIGSGRLEAIRGLATCEKQR